MRYFHGTKRLDSPSPIKSAQPRIQRSSKEATMTVSSHAAPSTASNMMPPAMMRGVSNPLRHRLRSAAANKRKQHARLWKLFDHERSHTVDVEVDSRDQYDERRATTEYEMRPDIGNKPSSSIVTGLVALPKELQLLIADYVSIVPHATHPVWTNDAIVDDERRQKESLPDVQNFARPDDSAYTRTWS
jgi:hypothetical protein